MIDRLTDREAPSSTRRSLDRSRADAASRESDRADFAIAAIVTMVLLTLGPVGLRYRLNLTTFLCLGTSAALLRAAHREAETAHDLSPM